MRELIFSLKSQKNKKEYLAWEGKIILLKKECIEKLPSPSWGMTFLGSTALDRYSSKIDRFVFTGTRSIT